MIHVPDELKERLKGLQILLSLQLEEEGSCVADLRRIYYVVIDIILGELEERFQPEALDLYDASEKITQMQDFSSGKSAGKVDLSVAESEKLVFHLLCKRKLPVDADFMMYLDICRPDLFPSVYQLLTSVAVCPISSVSVECLFSTLKRINAPNRRSMGAERFR